MYFEILFSDVGSGKVIMSNGKYYERNSPRESSIAKNEEPIEIDKVVIHKKRRRLSESPNERKSTPEESEARVTISKRISTESNASGCEPISGNSSGSNSPKNYSFIKRKKRKSKTTIF